MERNLRKTRTGKVVSLSLIHILAKPLITNSDQGSQFTSDKYIEFIRDNGIRQSMDGKSRWADNIMIERLSLIHILYLSR